MYICNCLGITEDQLRSYHERLGIGRVMYVDLDACTRAVKAIKHDDNTCRKCVKEIRKLGMLPKDHE